MCYETCTDTGGVPVIANQDMAATASIPQASGSSQNVYTLKVASSGDNRDMGGISDNTYGMQGASPGSFSQHQIPSLSPLLLTNHTLAENSVGFDFIPNISVAELSNEACKQRHCIPSPMLMSWADAEDENTSHQSTAIRGFSCLDQL